MSWKHTFESFMKGNFRLALVSCCFLIALAFMLSLVYFSVKFFYFTIRWLDTSLFSRPW